MAAKLSQKNCVNYQLDNVLIKGVVGCTIKIRQPKNVGDDGQESSTIKQVTSGPLESYTGGQELHNLDEADVAALGAPISMNEVREVLRKVPRAKTHGPDSLPYKIYRALPGHVALAIAKIANLKSPPWFSG